MKKTFVLIALVLVLALATVGTGSAITNGYPDGNGHPYVAVAHNGMWMCSASAISPTVLVTAAHCFDYSGETVYVSFSSEPPWAPYLTGTWYPHPDFCLGCGPGLLGVDTHDVAVIVLDGPVTLPRYASLPSQGLVDSLKMRTGVTVVGYGIQGYVRGGGQPVDQFDGMRYYANAELITSQQVNSDEYIKISANPAQDKGGVCFGDSGGPTLVGDSDTIIAVTSYGANHMCAGVAYNNRIDLPWALNFIDRYAQ